MNMAQFHYAKKKQQTIHWPTNEPGGASIILYEHTFTIP